MRTPINHIKGQMARKMLTSEHLEQYVFAIFRNFAVLCDGIIVLLVSFYLNSDKKRFRFTNVSLIFTTTDVLSVTKLLVCGLSKGCPTTCL